MSSATSPPPSRNSTNCPASAIANSDLPLGFDGNSTHLCGINFPQAAPVSNLSTCCAGAVHVSNGCFQYCEPKSDAAAFSSCVHSNIMGDGLPSVECNEFKSLAIHEKTVGAWWKIVGPLLLLSSLLFST